MARQPTEKLQGYGQTSSPSAAPIDSFTGAPAVPRETASTQLAQALNVMGGSVHSAGAKADAKKKHEEEELAKITAAAQAEQNEGYVSKVQVGEGNPALSIINQASIAETAAQNRAYASTSALFQSFLSDDDLVGNPAEMNQRIAAHKASIVEATKDMPFAGAGAMKGFNNAQREMTPSVLSRQGQLLRVAGAKSIADSVPEIVGGVDLNDPSAVSVMFDRIQAKDDEFDARFPNGKAERVANWKKGIIEMAEANLDTRLLEVLKQGWLKEKGDATYNAALKQVDALQTKVYLDKITNDEKVRKANNAERKQLINVSLANGETLDPREMAKEEPEVYDYFLQQSAKTAIEKTGSSTDKRLMSDRLEASYISGDFSFLGDRQGATGVPTDDEMYEYLDGLNLRPEHIEELKGSIDVFSKGYDALTDSEVSQFYSNRTGARVDALLKKRDVDDELDWDIRLDPKNDIKSTFISDYNSQWKAWYKSNPDTVLPPETKTAFLERANAVALDEYNAFLDTIDPPEPKQGGGGTPETTDLQKDQFDRRQGTITLDKNQITAVSKAIEALSDTSESSVMEAIAKVLGVEDDENFVYGFMDSADEPGEVALKELVEEYTKE
jgi:hypothetical protein